MKYQLIATEALAKAIYNISRFDIEYGETAAFQVLKNYLDTVIKSRAISACVDPLSDGYTGKEYEMGYVRGLHEMLLLLQKAVDKGEDLYFPRKIDAPKMV